MEGPECQRGGVWAFCCRHQKAFSQRTEVWLQEVNLVRGAKWRGGGRKALCRGPGWLLGRVEGELGPMKLWFSHFISDC